MEMQIDPILCDDGKPLAPLIREGEAQLPIKGQRLSQIPNSEAGSNLHEGRLMCL
jgi:hypothetical protein